MELRDGNARLSVMKSLEWREIALWGTDTVAVGSGLLTHCVTSCAAGDGGTGEGGVPVAIMTVQGYGDLYNDAMLIPVLMTVLVVVVVIVMV